jgi:hypothetical protein
MPTVGWKLKKKYIMRGIELVLNKSRDYRRFADVLVADENDLKLDHAFLIGGIAYFLVLPFH